MTNINSYNWRKTTENKQTIPLSFNILLQKTNHSHILSLSSLSLTITAKTLVNQ